MNNRNTTLILSLLFLGFGFSCSREVEDQKKTDKNITDQKILPEEAALIYLLDSLMIDNSILGYNDSIIYKVNLEDELVDLLNAKHRYSNGKMCLLSRPFMHSTDSIISALIKTRVGEYEKDYLKKKEDITVLSFNMPEGLEKLTWTDYLEIENDSNSLFITLRQHIETQNERQIEINISSINYAPNPSEFTFYIILNKDNRFLRWEFLIKDDFDETIDC